MTGELRRQGRLGRPGLSKTIVVPLVVQSKLAGVVRVTGRRPLASDLHQALQTLASQVEQSLESAALADDLLARQSEARFRSLVQNSRDLIAVVEKDFTIRYATPSVEAMLGHSADELIGTRLDELLHPDEREDTVAALAAKPRHRHSFGARVQAPAPRRALADRGGGRREPDRRPVGPGARAHGPRRHRAPRARGSARPPGLPRRAHGAAEPRAVLRSRPSRARPLRAQRARRRRSCSSTSTTSRPSTTASVTPPATSC